MVLMYAQLNTSNPQQQLETAETWLHGHNRSAALLLCLGKLCIKSKLWGKARNYLESSLGIKPIIETYLQLALLLQDKMDDHEQAQSYYKKGLELAVAESHSGTTGTEGSLIIKDTPPVLKVIQ
jgi:HemY protein